MSATPAIADADHAESPLQTSVQYVKGVGPRLAERLANLDIHTVGDLLQHYPNRYEDRRDFTALSQVRDGDVACVSGQLIGVATKQTRRRRMKVTTAVIMDDSGKAEMVFFNQPWLQKILGRLQGREICLYGKAERVAGELSFRAPEWEELDADADSLHARRIVPIHGATEGVTPRQLRRAVATALQGYVTLVTDPIPASIRDQHQLMLAGRALFQIHFPDSPELLEKARRRLVFDELFFLQLAMAERKRQTATVLPGIAFPFREGWLNELTDQLDFELTDAQERCIHDIQTDMAADHPMSRLLEGDVGSGKTVVAAAGILGAVRAGYQAAIMAPTEILAEQHYNVFRHILEPLGLSVHRLVGSVRAKGKRLIKEAAADGSVDLIVGTHALIQDDVEFQNLGLIIIDEQHRFGVVQRLALIDKGAIDRAPDVLVMTATPIPRTLALTAYGDLDVSVIDEMPPGRKPIVTHWKGPHQRKSVYEGVRRLVEEGRQAYIVCPLVGESEKVLARAATELHDHLSNQVFSDLRVGLLHGQMAGHEKDEVMDTFREGDYDVLVTTVVIEVGVDVPNACCMVIEDAERFGLAQLHQLRGRVGRGEHQSFCVLLGDPKSPEGKQRLQVLERTNDGFEIAEEDLKLRGPGEIAGTQQSGMLKLRIASLIKDQEILHEAREAAFKLVEHDPGLQAPEHAELRAVLQTRYGEFALGGAA